MKDKTGFIVREGLPFVYVTGLAGILAGLTGFYGFAVFCFLASLFCAFFFRNPERYPSADERTYVSPADGKVLRIDPAAVNPQGAAGNGVAGVKLAADGDEVIAALPLTCENGEAILSISEKGWKVTEVADIPVKGRGGAGVIQDADGLLAPPGGTVVA